MKFGVLGFEVCWSKNVVEQITEIVNAKILRSRTSGLHSVQTNRPLVYVSMEKS